jgi:hypothetical protein
LLSHFRDFFAWQFGGLVWSAKNLNKLALGDMTRENFLVSCLISGIFLPLYVLAVVLILGIFLHGLPVWFGLQNWNKLVLGDVTNQNFQVRGLILGTFSLDIAVWFGLQNLNKLALGDMTRQNFQVRGGIFRIFWLGLTVWFGLQKT